MMDVDYFKNYNDEYGHLAGDECLKKIARILEKTVLRNIDFVARYGGEEFVIFLLDTDSSGAAMVGERILRHVEDAGIAHAASEAAEVVTVSIGAATMVPVKTSSFEKLIDGADKQLYAAKNEGRNRIMATDLD